MARALLNTLSASASSPWACRACASTTRVVAVETDCRPEVLSASVASFLARAYRFPVPPFLRKRRNAAHQRQHLLRTSLARRRNEAREQCCNDKPRNKSRPECSHIFLSLRSAFLRACYRHPIGQQQGKSGNTTAFLRRFGGPVALAPATTRTISGLSYPLMPSRFPLLKSAAIFLLLVFFPVGVSAGRYSFGESRGNWQTADRSSAGLLPLPSQHSQAVIRVYGARTLRWKAIFAIHAWIVVKEQNASTYTRYDYTAWGEPIRTNGFAADARWFGAAPETIAAVDGPEASRLIPKIRHVVGNYKFRTYGDYNAWPGPNSNTFVQAVLDAVPELKTVLLSASSSRPGSSTGQQPLSGATARARRPHARGVSGRMAVLHAPRLTPRPGGGHCATMAGAATLLKGNRHHPARRCLPRRRSCVAPQTVVPRAAR